MNRIDAWITFAAAAMTSDPDKAIEIRSSPLASTPGSTDRDA